MMSRTTSRAIKSENEAFSKQVLSALFYAVSSFMITLMESTILSVYMFPSYQVLALSQMISTIIVLYIGRRVRSAKTSPLKGRVVCRMWPLAIIHLGNMATSLLTIEKLHFSMLAVSRRFVILLTMILENVFLGFHASCSEQACVVTMVAGAIIAAANHETFSRISSYFLVLFNNGCSAANGVYLKKILDSKELDLSALMFYDLLFMIVPASISVWASGDLNYLALSENWKNPVFVGHIMMSSAMALVLSYSVMLCTQYNSALTTTVIGSLMSILFRYFELVTRGDYMFSELNFVGLNISFIGGLVYTYITFKRKPAPTYLLFSNAKVDTA